MPMPPPTITYRQEQDLTALRGDTLCLYILFEQEEIDFTGCTVKAIAQTPEGGLGFDLRPSIQGVFGQALVSIQKDKEEMKTIAPKTYEYDMEFTFPNGFCRTYMYGKFYILQDIT